MRLLSTAAVCLICTAGFAQSPQLSGPPPGPMQMQGSEVNQSSRVRAFNAGPDGQIHSIYLANGSVVDLSSSFGPDLNSQIHRGTRIRVVGSRSIVGGQSIIVPQQLTVGQQSFSVQPNPGPDERAGMPPQRDGGPGIPPPPGVRNRVRRGPGGELAGTPPPPPGGPGMPPPPPHAGTNGPGQPPPPPGNVPTALGQEPGNRPRTIPPPAPGAQQPVQSGALLAPRPMDSTQPALAPPSAPKL